MHDGLDDTNELVHHAPPVQVLLVIPLVLQTRSITLLESGSEAVDVQVIVAPGLTGELFAGLLNVGE